MAEALAAVGLASSIVQFVDFGSKLLSDGRELYYSAAGVLLENDELETIVVNIKHVSEAISSNALGISDPALRGMTEACLGLASELLVLLQGLKLDGTKNRQLELMRKLWKHIMSKRAIGDINTRLCNLRDQVCFHLNYLLK
jgi:hypothetical protein